MKLFLSFLFSIFCPCLVFAQNYQDGYAITLKGDTLKGYFYHGSLDDNPKSVKYVKYQRLDIDKPQTLSVNDVRYFSFTGMESFVRCVLPISLDETNENHLTTRDTSFKIDTVFLEILQTGKYLNLYAYSDHIKHRYYITESLDESPKELIFRLYFPSDPNAYNRNTQSENTYKKQLSVVALKHNRFTDDIRNNIAQAEYTDVALVKAVNKINDASPAERAKKSYKHLGLIGLIVLVTFGILTVLNKVAN